MKKRDDAAAKIAEKPETFCDRSAEETLRALGTSAGGLTEKEAAARAEKYGAKFLFSEREAEVTDYYYYSPRLCGGVKIGGALVNLHVAVRGEGASVGSPLIFGGY